MSARTGLPTETLQIQFIRDGVPEVIAQRTFTEEDRTDWGDWARRMTELGHRMLDGEGYGNHEVIFVREDHEDFIPGLSHLSSVRPHWVVPHLPEGKEDGP